MTRSLWVLLLSLSLLFSSSGCGTLLTKIPVPVQEYEFPSLYTYPGVQFDLERINRGHFYLILDLPFSLVGDTFFVSLYYLLYPIAWLLRPWFSNGSYFRE